MKFSFALIEELLTLNNETLYNTFLNLSKGFVNNITQVHLSICSKIMPSLLPNLVLRHAEHAFDGVVVRAVRSVINGQNL